jgi:hypothetical protein
MRLPKCRRRQPFLGEENKELEDKKRVEVIPDRLVRSRRVNQQNARIPISLLGSLRKNSLSQLHGSCQWRAEVLGSFEKTKEDLCLKDFFCILVAGTFSMSACATGKVVPDPSNITLEAAMKSVGEGLKQMKEAQGDIKTGLLPSEVTVTFNVTASASDNSKLALTVSTPQATQLPLSGSLTGDVSSAISAARGNVITIKFTNLLFAPQNQFLTTKTAKEIEEILKTLKGEGVTLFVK